LSSSEGREELRLRDPPKFEEVFNGRLRKSESDRSPVAKRNTTRNEVQVLD
jgi:hypothetical protein